MSNLDFRYLDETGSTNDDLLTLAQQGAAEGTAIGAGHQLQGKGRRGRSWQDEPGQNALVSVLLRPGSGFIDIGLLAAIAAVVLWMSCTENAISVLKSNGLTICWLGTIR